MTDHGFAVAYARITEHGWLTREEAKFLVKWAEQTEGPIVEVGSYQGRSAMLLAQLGRPLVCVDPWDDTFHSDLSGEEIYRRFQGNIHNLWMGYTVKAVRQRVEDWTPIPAGFVYLDGDHTFTGTVAQIEKALACRPQVIALHDVNDDGGGAEVKRAALSMLGDWIERVGRVAVWKTS